MFTNLLLHFTPVSDAVLSIKILSIIELTVISMQIYEIHWIRMIFLFSHTNDSTSVLGLTHAIVASFFWFILRIAFREMRMNPHPIITKVKNKDFEW